MRPRRITVTDFRPTTFENYLRLGGFARFFFLQEEAMSEPLPFEPQPLSQLKLRLPAALERIWDVNETVRAIRAGRPIEYAAFLRTNVFDRLDGVRTCVSRDRDRGDHRGNVMIHASSLIFQPRSLAHDKLIANRYRVAWTRDYLFASTCELLGVPQEDCFLHNVAGKLFHFFFKATSGVPAADAEADGSAQPDHAGEGPGLPETVQPHGVGSCDVAAPADPAPFLAFNAHAPRRGQTKVRMVGAMMTNPDGEDIPIMPLSLLPARDGLCQWCYTEHDPGEPHDLTNLNYQIKFRMANRREATWTDAMAHCHPEIQRHWRTCIVEMLRERAEPVPRDLLEGEP
jgi:hypothetical protein